MLGAYLDEGRFVQTAYILHHRATILKRATAPSLRLAGDIALQFDALPPLA